MPNRCIWCGIWHHGAAVQAFQCHRQARFRGLYFHNAICRVASGSGCQARVSLINELLLKFHKSNPITQFPHAPSALMECPNVSFSHFCLEFIWLISAIHVLPFEFRLLRVYERPHVSEESRGWNRDSDQTSAHMDIYSCSWTLRETV